MTSAIEFSDEVTAVSLFGGTNITVWDSRSGDESLSIEVPRARATGRAASAFCLAVPAAPKSRKSKRRRSSSTTSAAVGILGMPDGTLRTLSLASGDISDMDGSVSGGVGILTSTGDLLAACSATSGEVVVASVRDGILGTIPAFREGSARAAAAFGGVGGSSGELEGGPFVAVGQSTVRVHRVSDGSVVATLLGLSGTVVGLCACGSLILGVSDDGTACAWDVGSIVGDGAAGKSVEAAWTSPLRHGPSRLRACELGKGRVLFLSCSSSEHAADAIILKPGKEERTWNARQHRSVVTNVGEQVWDVVAVDRTRVRMVVGSVVSPRFELVDVATIEEEKDLKGGGGGGGSSLKDMTVVVDLRKGGSQLSEDGQVKKSKDGAVVAWAGPLPAADKDEEDERIQEDGELGQLLAKRARLTQELSKTAISKSHLQKGLSLLHPSASSSTQATSSAIAAAETAAAAGSMATVLEASLRSGDAAAVGQILEGIPSSQIANSIRPLPASLIGVLADHLLTLFAASYAPERQLLVLSWLEPLLTTRMPALLSIRDFGRRIAPIFFEAMSAQVRSTAGVENLRGRIDFLLAVAASNPTGDAAAQQDLPTAIFDINFD